MLFNIENDFGDRVIAYCVPDTFTEVPELNVQDGNTLLFSLAANGLREALVSAGRHETGQCGFEIDSRMIPNLAEISDLRLVERHSGIPVYRRPFPDQINRKVLRFETSLYPLWRIDNQISSNFQYFEKGLERYGRETVTQMFVFDKYPSILLSGRILYRNFSIYIDDGFECYCIVQDPYEELAERFLVLATLSEIGAANLGDRDSARMAPAIAYARELDFENTKKLRKQLLDISSDVAHLLSNPLVRQFTTVTPDEMPTGNAIATTLDILSRFVAVTTRDRSDDFCQIMGASLNLDSGPIPRPQTFAKVREYGKILREIRVIDHLIEQDLAVFSHLGRALGAL